MGFGLPSYGLRVKSRESVCSLQNAVEIVGFGRRCVSSSVFWRFL